MWPPRGVTWAIFGIASASIFSEGPSASETDAYSRGASVSSDSNRRENPNLFTDSEWSKGEPYANPPTDWNAQNADSVLPETESNFLLNDDWASQLQAGTPPTSGCSAPTKSRLRLKRYDAQCSNDGQEEKPICETALFSIPACCLGPSFAEYVIVNRCATCRWF